MRYLLSADKHTTNKHTTYQTTSTNNFIPAREVQHGARPNAYYTSGYTTSKEKGGVQIFFGPHGFIPRWSLAF